MADLWLLRHGQAGAIMGDYDQLSPLGWKQAEVTGAAHQHLGSISRCVTGAMRRHRETYEGFSRGFGNLPPATTDSGWNEFDHQSVIQAALSAGIEPQAGGGKPAFVGFFMEAMGRWASGAHDDDYAEPYADFQARVVAALHRITQQLGSGESAMVFTSGGAISAVCRHLLELSPANAFRINLAMVNAGLTRLRVGPGHVSLASLNVHAHFDQLPELLTHS